MIPQVFATIMVIMLFCAPQRQDIKLSDFIPTKVWKRTGIVKLTDSEKRALKDEIVKFIVRYHRSLTDGVAVIAPSVSTSMKAREIRTNMRLKEVPFRYAESILVVVRSSLFDPLQYSYDSVVELRSDADNQLNITGPKFHVYLYSMDDDLAVTRINHKSFDAREE